MLYDTKPCKVYPKDGKYMMRIKQSSSNTFGVYSVESNTGEERLCHQLTDINGLRQFFLGVSGSDYGGKCSADITNLILTGEQPYQIVTQQEKKVGDDKFAYFDNSIKEENIKNFERFDKLNQYMKEDMKIVAQELLEFADKNEKEMMSDF